MCHHKEQGFYYHQRCSNINFKIRSITLIVISKYLQNYFGVRNNFNTYPWPKFFVTAGNDFEKPVCVTSCNLKSNLDFTIFTNTNKILRA